VNLDPAIADAVRREIIRHARRLVTEGLIVGTAGNISVRTGDGMIITPSGTPYDTLEPSGLCAVDARGRSTDPAEPAPSSETFLHLAAYRADASANAVVHFHGLHSVAVANTHDRLPLVHYYALRLGGAVPVVPYSTFGSDELARAVGSALGSHPAALMRNHGAVVTGRTLDEAFERALLLEWLCRLVTLSAPFGAQHLLTREEADAVAAKYAARRAEAEGAS